MHCDKGKKIPLWTDSGLLSRWSKQLTGKFKPEAGGRILQTAANPRVRRHSESSGMSAGLEQHVPGRPESTDGSHFPAEPCQTARQMSQPWKRSWSWPGGIGENRRDSQEPTGGLAHRKGSQTHSRWQSRWRRNMDTGRWAGRWPGAGAVGHADSSPLIPSDCRCCSQLAKARGAKEQLVLSGYWPVFKGNGLGSLKQQSLLNWQFRTSLCVNFEVPEGTEEDQILPKNHSRRVL